MRLALVVTGGVDQSGRDRVIPSLISLIRRLAPRHELHVFALQYLPTATSYPLLGATVHDLGRPRGLYRQCAALTTALQEHGPFDVVHGYWALPAGFASTVAARRLGLPCVVTFDSGEFVGIADVGYGARLSWKQRLAVGATARLAHRRLVCSRYQQALARLVGVDAEVLPFGSEPGVFAPASWPVEGPPWRLLNVANLNPVKDHATLLRALRRLLDQGLDLQLDIAGEDTLHGAARTLTHQLGLGAHVTFHDSVPHAELASLYQRSHLFVLSSRHEAAGVVLLEAALSGLPIVGSAVGYIADWQQTRAVGVPPRDPAALAEAVAAQLLNPAQRHERALAARTWALQHDADWTAEQLVRIYEESASRRTSQRRARG